MIGPAEIEEMMNEFAAAIEWTGAGDPNPFWPIFVSDSHVDRVDHEPTGSFKQWADAAVAKKGG